MKNSKMKSSIHKAKNLLIAGSIICLLGFSGCSKNNPLSSNCLSGNWLETVEKELSAYSTSLQAYSENPTESNCASVKAAGLSYITALDKIQNCVPGGSKSDFDQELEEAKNEIKNSSCD